MTDRFITVPDSLELPAAVKVPVARLVGPTGAAATPADLGAATAAQGALADSAVQPGDLGTAAAADAGDFATAAQGAKADAGDVAQITLTGNLALTIPEGHPAGQVYRCAITQTTGGHTVTYGDLPLTIDLTAGATTLVEVWPSGDVTYPGFGLAALLDNGDGTLTLSGSLVADNLDGTLTIGA